MQRRSAPVQGAGPGRLRGSGCGYAVTCSGAGSSAGAPLPLSDDTAVGRRLLNITATTMTSTAAIEAAMRAGVFLSLPTLSSTTAGAISSETRFITLISGLIAGPAVSLNGSPTVSPMTVAAWASEPLPPYEQIGRAHV